MRVKYCTINGNFHPNKHSTGPRHFYRALQKFVFPKNFHKCCLPSGPLQDCKLCEVCGKQSITTVQFHLNTETWKKIFLVEMWGCTNQREVKRHYWQLFKVRYYKATPLSWVVTSSATRGCLRHQPCRLIQVEVWFSSWSHPTAPSDNGTRAWTMALPW